MQIDLLSLFPDYFSGPFDQSMIKRAREASLVDLRVHDLRDHAEGKHKQVDDRPYGGGPGMLLMAEPITKAIRSLRQENSHCIYLSPRGKKLGAARCRSLAEYKHLIILCGHYEGIDQRAIELEVDEEISIGDYVLTSGCPAAAVLVDALLRFVPGVLGREASAEQDSFENDLLDCPHYTRPESFEHKTVPAVLLTGHHKNINQWRRERAQEITAQRRPDLLRSKA